MVKRGQLGSLVEYVPEASESRSEGTDMEVSSIHSWYRLS